MPKQLRFDFGDGSRSNSPELTQFQRRVLDWFKARSHLAHGICYSTKRIAEWLGSKVRYLQLAIQELLERRLLRKVLDYGLKTRRRYFVVGDPVADPVAAPPPTPPEPAPEPPFVSALECAQSAHWSALTTEVPPDPPNRSLERELKESGDDDSAAVAAPEPVAISEPVQSSSLEDAPSEPRKATKAEVAEVVAKAQSLFGRSFFATGRVKAEAKRCAPYGGGLSWISRALALAEAADARSWGYVAKTLANWREEGGPPAVRFEDRKFASYEEYEAAFKAHLAATQNDEWERAMFGATVAELQARAQA